jgi:hypothetical protein
MMQKSPATPSDGREGTDSQTDLPKGRPEPTPDVHRQWSEWKRNNTMPELENGRLPPQFREMLAEERDRNHRLAIIQNWARVTGTVAMVGAWAVAVGAAFGGISAAVAEIAGIGPIDRVFWTFGGTAAVVATACFVGGLSMFRYILSGGKSKNS